MSADLPRIAQIKAYRNLHGCSLRAAMDALKVPPYSDLEYASWQCLPAAQASAAPALTPEQANVLAFLNGAAPLDGKWFGDREFGQSMYWWRINLMAAFGVQLSARLAATESNKETDND